MRRVRASVVNLFYATVILVAAFKSLIFAATLYAENHIDKVEQWTSQIIGRQIHIDQIRASWSGLLPKIWLENLSLGNEERLRLGDVRVSVNVPSLPWWKTNPPLDIQLKGTRINILREISGETRVLGLAAKQPIEIHLLPAHIHIEDASILWQDNKHGGAELQLEHMDVHLTNRGEQARLVVNSPQHDLLIRSDLEGNVLGHDWSANTYFRTSHLKANSFASPYLPEQFVLDELDLGLEFWSQWHDGQHVASQAKLQLHQLNMRHSNGHRLILDSASTRLQFRRDPNHWQLQFSDFRIDSAKGQWPATDILLDLSAADPGLQHLRIGMGQIPLGLLNRLSGIFRPPGNLDQLLSQIAPTGELYKVRAHLLAGATPEIKLLAFSTDFSALSTRAWGKIPAASNFSGHLRIGSQTGSQFSSKQLQMDLDSRHASLVFPSLFRDPLPLSLVRGRLSWQGTTGGDWRLKSDGLIVDSPDLKTISRIAIQARPEEPLFLDLQTDFRDGVGANAGTYYPVGIMQPKLVEWLDKSIVSGSVPSGSFLLRGPLQGFPYHQTHTGHFEVLFDAEDLLLDYQQGWPELKHSNARIRFYNNELQIDVNSASILDSKVTRASAHIPSLKPGSAIDIQGQASGPLADALRFVRETPLKKKLAAAVEGMQASGNTDARLKFSIPLAISSHYQFDGQLTMQEAELKLTRHQLDLSQINGQLNLDLNGIRAKGIRLKALGGELQLDMRQSDHASTLIEVTGTLPITEVQKQYPYLKPIQASGSATTLIQLDLPNHKQASTPATLRLYSDLKGISLNLPPPLDKTSEVKRSLNVRLPLNTSQSKFEINYADQVQLQIEQHESAGYRITGSIEDLPLHNWLGWYAQIETLDDSGSFELDLLDLSIDHFSLSPFTASALQLTINHQQQQWLGKLESKLLQGSFRIPTDLSTQPLVVEMDKLTIHMAEESTQDQPDPLPTDNLNPQAFPSIHFSCKDLMIDEARLGELELKTRKIQNGMLIDKASLVGSHVESQLTGAWVNSADGTLTSLNGDLKSTEPGRLLHTIYAATPLADSETSLDFNLSWTGAPFQYHPANLQGSINLSVGKGRVLDLDPGAARMLGLLNIRTLSRRLQLDFSDLYKEGLSFDSIQGTLELGIGYIYTNDLTIKSPSALIQISGNADLILQQYDQLITISPQLDATLPVAGALVGGPATGLAVLLAQQIMSKPLSKLQRIKYNLRGPWDDPKITRIKRQNKPGKENDILDL